MNTTEGNTPADAAPAAKDRLTITFGADALATMPTAQLRALCSAVRTLLNVSTGVVSEPRFSENSESYNGAGSILMEVSEWLAHCHDAIFEAVKASAPDTHLAVEDRAVCLIECLLDRGEGLSDIAVAAAECARDEAEVLWRERRAA